MQSRPIFTFTASLLLAAICAAGLLPVVSSGDVDTPSERNGIRANSVPSAVRSGRSPTPSLLRQQAGPRSQGLSPGANPPLIGRASANSEGIRQVGFIESREKPEANETISESTFEFPAPIKPAEESASGQPDELGPIPVSSPATEFDPATDILEQARKRLISYESIRADLIETVALGGHRFRMKGSYLQGTNLRLRLDCQVQVGSTTGKMTEVCDGQILWSWQQIGESQRVTRRNVRQIERAAQNASMTTSNLLLEELGFGGLPALIAALQKSFQFDRLVEQDVDGIPLIVMDGLWRADAKKQLVGNVTAPLPSHIPDRVRLYLQRDRLFPRRVLYLKKGSKKNHFRPLVSLDFVNVVWDGPLDETAFEFTPPEGVRREDVTQEYIRRFSQQPQNQNNLSTNTQSE